MKTPTTLKAIESELLIYEDELSALRSRIKELVQKKNEIIFGVKPGDEVQYRNKIYIIERFDTYWPVGRLRTKSGKLSLRTSPLFNYPKKEQE